jgi:hypothetical protein
MKQHHYMTHLLCNVPLSCVIQPLLNPPLCYVAVPTQNQCTLILSEAPVRSELLVAQSGVYRT